MCVVCDENLPSSPAAFRSHFRAAARRGAPRHPLHRSAPRCTKMAALRYCFHRLHPAVRFHCSICMSGASQRGCGMTGAPADPQSCCHPSSPRSSSWMVWSPSNRGPGFAAHGPEAIGKSIDTPRPSLASWLNPPPIPQSSPSPSLWPNEDEAVVSPPHLGRTWRSCSRIRNARAGPGARVLQPDVSVLSTGLRLSQYLD